MELAKLTEKLDSDAKEADKRCVGSMVREYLEENNFDGLYNADGECACLIDDLFPCGSEWRENCIAGYKCKCDCGEHDWHINLRKD